MVVEEAARWSRSSAQAGSCASPNGMAIGLANIARLWRLVTVRRASVQAPDACALGSADGGRLFGADTAIGMDAFAIGA
jgi:hypothetical protein